MKKQTRHKYILAR